MNQIKSHILVVDDHKDIRDPLAEYLTENGYRTSVAASGTEMNRILGTAMVDLIVLDVLLPGEGGLEICQRVRKTWDVPMILLTAVGEVTDKIVGLEVGADDYMTKPFNPRELLARVRSVLRRANSLPRQYSDLAHKSILFGDLKLDVGQQTVTDVAGGEEISLSTLEFRLLMAFLAHPKMVLSREQLLERVSNREADVFDRSVDNQVSRLRKKIDPDTRNPKIIKTVWGGGYMMIAEVVKT